MAAAAWAFGQEPPTPPPGARTPRPPGTVQVNPRPAPPAPRVALPRDSQTGPVTLKVARGTRIVVSSRMANVHIEGIDGETIEASATSDDGPMPVRADRSGDEANPKVMIYVPQGFGRHPGDIYLRIKAPRFVAVESAESLSGDIDVSGIDGAVALRTNSGTIKAIKVGALRASTQSGEITARAIKGDAIVRSTSGELSLEDIEGAVDAATNSGELTVNNAGGDLRANVTVGEVSARCIKGRAEVHTASGEITLIGVGGDVDASSASGGVTFTGKLRANGNYRLKSISGEIEMRIQSDPPGFTATMLTYSGEIETQFALHLDTPFSGGSVNRRLTGVFGDGGTKLILDAFSGAARLLKAKPDQLKVCK